MRIASSQDVVICIPTKRPPPVATLTHPEFNVGPHEVLIIADPAVYDAHHDCYRGDGPWTVVRGVEGMAPQVAECYRQAYVRGYHWYFRLDDDLGPKTFVDLRKRKTYVSLIDAIDAAYECARVTETNLAGFENGTMTYGREIKREFRRTYGLIHGGAHLCCATREPSRYLDPSLRHFEDVYRSLAHREECGAVGRVKWIGLDKSSSGGATSTIKKDPKSNAKEIALILKRFPGMVTCDGTRAIHNGQEQIANWRMRPSPKQVSLL